MNQVETPRGIEVLSGPQSSKSSIIFGAVLSVLGLLALLAPMVPGISVAALVGMLLASSGIVGIVFSSKAGPFGKGILSLLLGIMATFAGLLIVATPADCPGVVMDVLTVFLIVGGILPILALGQRSEEGFGYKVFSGIVSMTLAVLLASRWPVSGAWAMGIYVGVRIMVHGGMLIALGRRGQRETPPGLADCRTGDGGVGRRKRVPSSEIDPADLGLHLKLDEARENLHEVAAAAQDANPPSSVCGEKGRSGTRAIAFYIVAIGALIVLCLAAVLWPQSSPRGGENGPPADEEGTQYDCP